MAINRRNDQISSTPFKGANSLLLTGKETGSGMLSVNEIIEGPAPLIVTPKAPISSNFDLISV